MTGQTADEQQRATDSVARLRLVDGPLLAPVLWRVVSMVLARADWPLDRLDDALLICDALCAHAPPYASGGRLSFSIAADGREAELRVLDLVEGGAEALARDASLPVVGNVLEQIAERLSVQDGGAGAPSQLSIVLHNDGAG